jgi:uncharacterized protein (TIGR00266 family)
MEVSIQYGPSNTAAKIDLQDGEVITAEAGSMIAMNGNLSVETSTHKKGKGSFLKSLKRMFAGESFFLNHYTSNGSGELWLSSTLSGEMITKELSEGETLIVQAGSFVAAEHSVNMDVGWQGFKNILSGEGLFWLKLTGPGKIVLTSFGCIYEVIDDDDGYVVDTGHIVAFEESLNFSISKAGTSWFSSFLGGEGFVCKFSGRGKIWCQSHNSREFGSQLTPFLRPKKR